MRAGTAERGAWAEQMAHDHLVGAGLTCIARNYRCRRGEIDLVMRDGDETVFVEVRYRSRDDYGSGAESVDARKQRRISAAASLYIARHPAHGDRPCRFDVVSVSPSPRIRPRIQWIRDAFDFAL